MAVIAGKRTADAAGANHKGNLGERWLRQSPWQGASATAPKATRAVPAQGGASAAGNCHDLAQVEWDEGNVDHVERRLYRRKWDFVMKKRLPAAKFPLPKFKPADEAAAFYSTHSVAEIGDQISAAKSDGYQTQLRVWIAEGICRRLGKGSGWLR